MPRAVTATLTPAQLQQLTSSRGTSLATLQNVLRASGITGSHKILSRILVTSAPHTHENINTMYYSTSAEIYLQDIVIVPLNRGWARKILNHLWNLILKLSNLHLLAFLSEICISQIDHFARFVLWGTSRGHKNHCCSHFFSLPRLLYLLEPLLASGA